MAGASAGIRVDGARQLRRSLKRAHPDLIDQLKAAHASVAGVVAARAKPTAPVGVTGRLSASVRPGATKTAAVVRAGRSTVPYAGVIHYGWPRRNIKAQPFLSDAAQTTESTWTTLYAQAVDDVLRHIAQGV